VPLVEIEIGSFDDRGAVGTLLAQSTVNAVTHERLPAWDPCKIPVQPIRSQVGAAASGLE